MRSSPQLWNAASANLLVQNNQDEANQNKMASSQFNQVHGNHANINFPDNESYSGDEEAKYVNYQGMT